MKIKKISIFIACVLLFSCFPLQSFAGAAKNLQFELRVDTENNNDSVISADENNVVVEAGGEFTVDVYLRNTSDEDKYTITNLQHELEFDENFFELKNVECKKADYAYLWEYSSWNVVRSDILQTKVIEFENNELLVRITFKVKDGYGNGSSSTLTHFRTEAKDSITPTVYDISAKELTVTVGERPKYVVEVGEDYVGATKLVLVYTNEEGISFDYDGVQMFDVSGAGYKYNGTGYTYVYGLVVEGTKKVMNAETNEEETIPLMYEEFYNNVKVDYEETAEKIDYTVPYDVNLLGDSGNWLDIIAIYSVADHDEDIFVNKYMKQIIKADTNRDKVVRTNDTDELFKAVYVANN